MGDLEQGEKSSKVGKKKSKNWYLQDSISGFISSGRK